MYDMYINCQLNWIVTTFPTIFFGGCLFYLYLGVQSSGSLSLGTNVIEAEKFSRSILLLFLKNI